MKEEAKAEVERVDQEGRRWWSGRGSGGIKEESDVEVGAA